MPGGKEIRREVGSNLTPGSYIDEKGESRIDPLSPAAYAGAPSPIITGFSRDPGHDARVAASEVIPILQRKPKRIDV